MYVLSGLLYGVFYGPFCTVVAIYTWNSSYDAFQDVALNSFLTPINRVKTELVMRIFHFAAVFLQGFVSTCLFWPGVDIGQSRPSGLSVHSMM